MLNERSEAHLGWQSWLAAASLGILVFETVSGLAITLSRFHAAVEWGLLVHTVLGLATLAPLSWYMLRHWTHYRKQALNDVLLLGYVGLASLAVCSLSGLVVTWEGLFQTRTLALWRNTHLISTLAAGRIHRTAPGLVVPAQKQARAGTPCWRLFRACGRVVRRGYGCRCGADRRLLRRKYANQLPKDYSYIYGKDRPFAPSLARTATGGAYERGRWVALRAAGRRDATRRILEEWRPSRTATPPWTRSSRASKA